VRPRLPSPPRIDPVSGAGQPDNVGEGGRRRDRQESARDPVPEPGQQLVMGGGRNDLEASLLEEAHRPRHVGGGRGMVGSTAAVELKHGTWPVGPQPLVNDRTLTGTSLTGGKVLC
jgi:hypothetical protein